MEFSQFGGAEVAATGQSPSHPVMAAIAISTITAVTKARTIFLIGVLGSELFVSQRNSRIHFHGAMGRQIVGQESNDAEQCDYNTECYRIGRPHPVKQRRK